jgi:Berberine and berberine like
LLAAAQVEPAGAVIHRHPPAPRLRPWSVDQAPPNFLEPDEGDTRLRRSYGEDKYRKLVTLKNTYDPHNVCRSNIELRGLSWGHAAW